MGTEQYGSGPASSDAPFTFFSSQSASFAGVAKARLPRNPPVRSRSAASGMSSMGTGVVEGPVSGVVVVVVATDVVSAAADVVSAAADVVSTCRIVANALRTSAFIGARVLQKLRDHFCQLTVWQRLRSSLAPSPCRCSRRGALRPVAGSAPRPVAATLHFPSPRRPVSRRRGCRCGRRWRGGGRGGARVVDATLFAAAPHRYAATCRPFSLPAAHAAVGGGRVWGGGCEQEVAAPPLSLTAARAAVGGRVRGRRNSAGHLLLSPAAAVAPPAAAPAATCLCCLCFCYLLLGPADWRRAVSVGRRERSRAPMKALFLPLPSSQSPLPAPGHSPLHLPILHSSSPALSPPLSPIFSSTPSLPTCLCFHFSAAACDSLPPPLASLLPPSFSVWARIALFLLLHHSPSASSSPSPSLSASPSPDQSVQSPALGSVSSLSTAPATATRPSSPPPATALPLPNHHHHHQHERWQPYISSLPSFKAVDSTVWWGELERSMLLPSLYNDTCDRTALIQSEFATIQTTLTDHPHLRSFLPNLTYDQFCHAYLLVCSRAWGIEALGNLALVPYADMINHNPHTHTLLCYDEEQQAVEIIADRDYEPGEQVLVSYGNLSSGVLALDFGFTVPDNPHDSVELCVLTTSSSTPHDAQLNEAKRRLLVEAQLLPCDSASGACFVLKRIDTPASDGRGLPFALRAMARILTAASDEQ
ncbi:unnamed protein product, partial [Closterium sp. NIES-54]